MGGGYGLIKKRLESINKAKVSSYNTIKKNLNEIKQLSEVESLKLEIKKVKGFLLGCQCDLSVPGLNQSSNVLNKIQLYKNQIPELENKILQIKTICSSCGKDITNNSDNCYDDFIICKLCNKNSVRGNYNYFKLKGGKNVTMENTIEKNSKKLEKKYSSEIQTKILDLVKSGKSIKEVSKEFKGYPNPNAIKRWCVKANIKFE